MALNTQPGWTTKDYFDPWPGIEMGMRRRDQSNREQMQREGMKRADLDRAVQDQRYKEEQAMRQADALARMGVDPVPAAGGGIDWTATSKAAREKAEMAKNAEALATQHAWSGGPTQLSQEEYAITQTPEYQRTYRMVGALKAQKDAEQAARMEQIGARGAAALQVAEQRGENANRPMAYITRETPNGTVRIPVDPQEAMRMGQEAGGAGKADRWQEAIDKITRFRDEGVPIDIEMDDEGFPKVSKSWMSHDASPKSKGSYDRAIEKIMKRSGKTVPAPSTNPIAARPMLTIPR